MGSRPETISSSAASTVVLESADREVDPYSPTFDAGVQRIRKSPISTTKNAQTKLGIAGATFPSDAAHETACLQAHWRGETDDVTTSSETLKRLAEQRGPRLEELRRKKRANAKARWHAADLLDDLQRPAKLVVSAARAEERRMLGSAPMSGSEDEYSENPGWATEDYTASEDSSTTTSSPIQASPNETEDKMNLVRKQGLGWSFDRNSCHLDVVLMAEVAVDYQSPTRLNIRELGTEEEMILRRTMKDLTRAGSDSRASRNAMRRLVVLLCSCVQIAN